MALTLGDPITARYELRDPATGVLTDATVSVAVTRPDGTAQPPVGVTHPGTGLYQAVWLTDAAGVWRWTFVATGALADTTEGAAYVWAVGVVPAWTPTRRQVAKYIPERTYQADQATDVPLGDFTDATTPTGPQADEHIAAAVGWVQTTVGTVAAALTTDATEVASVRAAGMIELAYPVRNADLDTSAALLAQADRMRADLRDANEAAGSVDVPGVLPVWAFPDPVAWGDDIRIW